MGWGGDEGFGSMPDRIGLCAALCRAVNQSGRVCGRPPLLFAPDGSAELDSLSVPRSEQVETDMWATLRHSCIPAVPSSTTPHPLCLTFSPSSSSSFSPSSLHCYPAMALFVQLDEPSKSLWTLPPPSPYRERQWW